MAPPTMERFQQCLGRRGYAHFHAVWTASAGDDLSNQPVVDLDDISGKLNETRFGVESIDWQISSSGGSATVEFDSVPPGPDGLVVAIVPSGDGAGQKDFANYPSGCIPDPNRDSPGNVVVNTNGMQQGDELFLAVRFKEKGKSKP